MGQNGDNAKSILIPKSEPFSSPASPDHCHLPVKVCYEHAYNSAQELRKPHGDHMVVTKCPDSVYLLDEGAFKIGKGDCLILVIIILRNLG